MAIVQPLFHTQQIIVSEGVSRNYIRLPYKVLLVQGEDYESPDELRTCAHIKEKFIAAVADDIGADAPVTGLVAPLDSFEVNVQALDWAYVIVTYSSSNAFGGGFRPMSRSSSRTTRAKRPRYTELPSAGGQVYARSDVEYERGAARLIKQVVTGNWTDADSAQEQGNINHLFEFGGVPYLYVGATALNLGNGQAVIEYTFWTLGPMHAIPAGAIAGDDIALPSLGFLDEWVANDAGPTIAVAGYAQMYGQGGTLPHSNINGGGG